MRTLDLASTFRQDRKRVNKTPHHADAEALLLEVINLLVADAPLPSYLKDHALSGEWKNYRDCHLKNDLVLIYGKFGNELRLARLGSHSELFSK